MSPNEGLYKQCLGGRRHDTRIHGCQAISTWLYGEVHHKIHSMVRSSSTCALTELLLTTAALRTRMRAVHCNALRTRTFKLLKAAHVRMCALEVATIWYHTKTYCPHAAQSMGCARPSNRPVSTQRGLSNIIARAMAGRFVKPSNPMMHYMMVAGDHVAPSAVAAPPHQPLMARLLLCLDSEGALDPVQWAKQQVPSDWAAGAQPGGRFKAERRAAATVHR
jgi:hypothetical protein